MPRCLQPESPVSEQEVVLATQLKLTKKPAVQELFLDTFYVTLRPLQLLVWRTQPSGQITETAMPLHRCLVRSILHELTREGTQMSYTEFLFKFDAGWKEEAYTLFWQQGWTTDKN